MPSSFVVANHYVKRLASPVSVPARPPRRRTLRAVGTLPADGVLCVISGPGTRKSRNLARDPRCVLTVSTHRVRPRRRGDARIVIDRARLERIAEVYAAQGWPANVNDESTALTAPYSAPSAGPPPWHAYEPTPTKVIAVGGEPGRATALEL